MGANKNKKLYGILSCLLLFSAMGAFAYYNFYSAKNNGRSLASTPTETFVKLQSMITESMENVRVVEKSIARNSNRFSCLDKGSKYCQDKDGLFILFSGESQSATALSQVRKGHGLNEYMQGCQGFPSSECAYRIETNWQSLDSSMCDPKRSMELTTILKMDNGKGDTSEWSTKSIVAPVVALSGTAKCECEGKIYYAGACKMKVDLEKLQAEKEKPQELKLRDIAEKKEFDERLNAERREDERSDVAVEDPLGDKNFPQCPQTVDIKLEATDSRGKAMEVKDISPTGAGFVYVDKDNGRCVVTVTYQFQCEVKMKGKKGVWKEKGSVTGVCIDEEEQQRKDAEAQNLTPDGLPIDSDSSDAAGTTVNGKAMEVDQNGNPVFYDEEGKVIPPDQLDYDKDGNVFVPGGIGYDSKGNPITEDVELDADGNPIEDQNIEGDVYGDTIDPSNSNEADNSNREFYPGEPNDPEYYNPNTGDPNGVDPNAEFNNPNNPAEEYYPSDPGDPAADEYYPEDQNYQQQQAGDGYDDGSQGAANEEEYYNEEQEFQP